MFSDIPPWLRNMLLYGAFAAASLMGASATMRAAFPNGIFGSLIDPLTGRADGVELLKNILTIGAGYFLLITLLFQKFFEGE